MLHPQPRIPATIVTRTLQEVIAGVPGAEHRLWELVFPTCVEIARRELHGDRMSRFLHPRELVNMAFLKLTDGQMPPCPDRHAFFALASRAMRQAMIETARKVLGRNGDRASAQVPDRRLAELEQGAAWQANDVLALEEALVDLARVDPRKARTLELRFYSHLKVHEIAEVLGVARRTATQDLSEALVWLAARLCAPE